MSTTEHWWIMNFPFVSTGNYEKLNVDFLKSCFNQKCIYIKSIHMKCRVELKNIFLKQILFHSLIATNDYLDLAH